MMKNLVLYVRGKMVELDENGEFIPNNVIERVHHFLIERRNSRTYLSRTKKYFSLKEAFKAVIHKMKKYPQATYFLYMDYLDKIQETNITTILFSFYMDEENVISVYRGYTEELFCTIYLESGYVEFEEEVNKGNRLFDEWLPKKRNRKLTPLQEKIQSFQRFNILSINFKGMVKDEYKEHFLKEMEYCFEQINEAFPMSEYFPILEIFFSKYSEAKGKYGVKPLTISLNPNFHHFIRDTIYHEYGHFLYETGQFGLSSMYILSRKADRSSALEKMDEILNILYKEPTLTEIANRAKLRMNMQKTKRKTTNIAKYRTKHEEYLLRSTEVFARLFESFMLLRDHQKGESLNYRLDFKEEEIKKVEPLLLEYLSIIKNAYKQEESIIGKILS
jgi:hypothetical protein